jgi:ribosomal-protein-alanine N-acetyltransferase
MAVAYAGADAVKLRPLGITDVPSIMTVERRAYQFPWSSRVFHDCLRCGHLALGVEQEAILLGYCITSVMVETAHILNLCIDPGYQGRGLGRRLLNATLDMACGRGAKEAYLEVRPSNQNALSLYASLGFREIGRRKRYYPMMGGREDAIVMALSLLERCEAPGH